MEYFSRKLFRLNILQAYIPCKLKKINELLPKYPPGGRGTHYNPTARSRDFTDEKSSGYATERD
jgi:hypothetical protein